MVEKRHRIFLDSNVLLSGLISERGAPRRLLDILALDLPILAGLTGRYNLIEVERNIAKKAPDAWPVFQAYLPKLKLEIVPLPSPDEVSRLAGTADPKDIPVLASALQRHADYLVTGDKKLYSATGKSRRFAFQIAGPTEFLDRVLPRILKTLEPQ
jgi:predicted nucleic acid-binding protein